MPETPLWQQPIQVRQAILSPDTCLTAQERLQFRQRFLGSTLLKVVAAIDRFAADLGAFLFPDRQNVLKESWIEAAGGPQREQRAGDLLPGLDVVVIVLQIDGGGGAIVLAHAMLHLKFHAMTEVLALDKIGRASCRERG